MRRIENVIRMSRAWGIVILAAITLCLPAPDAQPATWQGKIVERDGVRHVLNPATPIESKQRLETEEAWRLESEGDALFGTIGTVVRNARGMTFLLDLQLDEVHVVGPGGRYLGAIGRPGEGPGEFRMSSGVALLNDTTLCVTQVVPARAVLMTVEGRALGDHALPPDLGTTYLNGCASVGGRLALKLAQLVQRETSVGLRTEFAVIDAGGAITTTYWERLQTADFANIEFDEKEDSEPVWAFGEDGRFYLADDWDAYAIRVVSPEGNIVHVIERAYEHRPRVNAELDQIKDAMSKGEISPDTKVADTSPDVARIVPRGDGSVWVLSSRGEMEVPSGAIAVFDVFDNSGRFVREVEVAGSFVPGRDAFRMAGDCVFVVTNAGQLAGMDDEEAPDAHYGSDVICLQLKSAR